MNVKTITGKRFCKILAAWTMRRQLVLLATTVALCVETAPTAAQPRGGTPPYAAGAAGWQPWRAPVIPLSPADAALGTDLGQHVEATGALLRVVKTFPLAGHLLDGRTFWAAYGIADWTHFVFIVYERRGDGWREVARHDPEYFYWAEPGLGPVEIEPAHAWVVITGGRGKGHLVAWQILRFDRESLHVEFGDEHLGWHDVMVVDVDRDGTLDVVARADYCNVCDDRDWDWPRTTGLYRWNGARMARVAFESLPAGSASRAAVAANERIVELARARRWTEAGTMLDAAAPLVAEHAVFRRNAALVDPTARRLDGDWLHDDRLLHHVLTGSWAEAVDIFRNGPILPDFFADPPRWYAPRNAFGTMLLRQIFHATAEARRTGPPRPEIEFLYAWAAFHLDPDTTSLDRFAVERLIDSDGSVVLDALDRAVRLAPGDPLFAAAQQFVARRAQ